MMSCISCAGLLDLPDDPHLAEPVEASRPAEGDAPPSPAGSSEDESPTEADVEPAPSTEGSRDDVQLEQPEPTPDPGELPLPPSPAAADAGASSARDAAPASDPCITGATLGPNERCYALVSAVLTWDDARLECQALGPGWDLVSIRDAAANDFVAGFVTIEAWLGGTDVAVEGSWRWVGDAQPFWNGNGENGAAVGGAFENWNSDEPNGAGPSDCMRLVAGRGTWADLQCSFERPALCEGPAL